MPTGLCDTAPLHAALGGVGSRDHCRDADGNQRTTPRGLQAGAGRIGLVRSALETCFGLAWPARPVEVYDKDQDGFRHFS